MSTDTVSLKACGIRCIDYERKVCATRTYRRGHDGSASAIPLCVSKNACKQRNNRQSAARRAGREHIVELPLQQDVRQHQTSIRPAPARALDQLLQPCC